MRNFIPNRQLPRLPLLNLLAKFVKERKNLMNDFTFVRLKFSTKKQKSINSQTNNKFPGNDDLTAEFYEHFSN